MWEVQGDWGDMSAFWVKLDDDKFGVSSKDGIFTSNDKRINISTISSKSFTVSFNDANCTFVQPNATFDTHKGVAVNCMCVSPNGEEILSGDSAGKLYLRYKDTEPVPLEGPSAGIDIEDCFIDQETKRIYSCGGDFRIYCFGSDYFLAGKLTGHKSSVKRIMKKDDKLFSGSADGTFKKWDLSKYQNISTTSIDAPITDFCKSDSAFYVCTDSYIRCVDANTGLIIPGPDNGSSEGYMSIDINGNKLATGNDSGVVSIWDIRQLGKPIAEWNWYDSMINKVRYYNDQLWIVTNDGTAAAIDPEKKISTCILGTPSFEAIKALTFDHTSIYTAAATGLISRFTL
jgi:WD40 repeat protein